MVYKVVVSHKTYFRCSLIYLTEWVLDLILFSLLFSLNYWKRRWYKDNDFGKKKNPLWLFDVFPSGKRWGKIDKIYSKCNLINSCPYWYYEHVSRLHERREPYIIMLQLGTYVRVFWSWLICSITCDLERQGAM